MSLTCSSTPSSPTQANSSFTSINTKGSQLHTKSGQFAVGSTQSKAIKAALEASNILSQAANAVDVLLQFPEDEASTQVDKIHQLAALYTK